jgi:hypothetical protein
MINKNVVVVLLLASAFFTLVAAEKKEPAFHVRIDCYSKTVALEPKKAPENGFLKHYSWGNKESRKFTLTGEAPISATPKWERFVFAFVPLSDGKVTIRLMSNHSSFKKGGSRDSYNAHWIYFDNVKISGAEGCDNGGFEIVNSKGLPTGWSCGGGKKNIPDESAKPLSGSKMIKAWHNQGVEITVTVKKNVPVTIVFNAKKAYFEAAGK